MLYELEKFDFSIGHQNTDVNIDDFIVVHEEKVLVFGEPTDWRTMNLETVTQWQKASQPQFIGSYRGKGIAAITHDETVKLPDNANWFGLRQLLPYLSETWFSILSRAIQVNLWQQNHRYCGRCGEATQRLKMKELVLHCARCNMDYYPRIAPCIIALVHKGDHILLARNSMAKRKAWYSTLAGFIECGESAEQALHREIKEEVNIEVQNVCYQNSQAWPFPNQLMLGFFAEYKAGDIKVDGNEIIDAKWWPIDDLPSYPPSLSISGWLIESYIKQYKAK